MDMSILMQAGAAAAVQNSGTSQSPRLFDEGDSSFLEILGNYWSGTGSSDADSLISSLGYGSPGNNDLLSTLGLYGMENSSEKSSLEAYLSLMSNQNGTVLDVDGTMKNIAGKIEDLLAAAGKGENNEEAAAELVSLLKKAQNSLSKTLELYGNDLAIAELSAFMQELGTPKVWQSYLNLDAGSGSSAGLNVLEETLSAKPEQLWEMLTQGSFYAQGDEQKSFAESMAAQIAGMQQGTEQKQALTGVQAETEKNQNAAISGQAEQLKENQDTEITKAVWTDPSKLDKLYEKSVMQGLRQGSETASQKTKTESSAENQLKDFEIQGSDKSAVSEKKFAADAEFSAAIHKARETINGSADAKADKTQTLAAEDDDNVKTAQVQPQNSRHVSFVQKSETDSSVSKQAEIPLTRQVHTGIVKGISEGKQEFTIKLNPEGLGEITVKLEKAGESMNLKIITGNPETRNALEARLDVLKDSLKPFKVDVDNIYTERQFEMLSQQQSSHQQGAFKHFRDGWQMNSGGQGGSYKQGHGGANETAVVEAEAESVSKYRGDTALDTYI